MNIKTSGGFIASGKFLYHRKLALFLWFGLSLFTAVRVSVLYQFNNYIIYRSVIPHMLQHVNLYLHYPQQYNDVYLYGPVFGWIIAPFSLLPDRVGVVCWVMANAAFLFYAISRLPLPHRWKTALLVLNAHELMFSAGWVQVNALICGCILLGFAYIEKEREWAALFFIMLATFIKIYGIVGFGFFFFSRHRLRFILWTVMWSVFFFLAPLLLTSFSFLIHSYKDWAQALHDKSFRNELINRDSLFQNISVMGLIRRIYNQPHFNDALVLVPAGVVFCSQYLHWRYFKDIRFRIYLLASILIATVIFSNGAETPTYIIALPGMCLWWLLQPKRKSVNLFFIVLFLFTTFSYSDLFGSWFRNHIMRPYSLKALPATILWVVIVVQIHRLQFLKAVKPFGNLPAERIKTYNNLATH